MNVLDKIVQLRESRKWSEYQLAEKSGLTQSTISSWYRKNMLPTIPSLQKICDAFDITLSQFFMEENEEIHSLTDNQSKLLQAATRLQPEQYQQLIKFIESL
ncbi:MAG: helix-turn-helix transcriptional regulator [Lachnospiraceae bacterium]|nr:helix-turn-helix transcriptional regulator [Lachnospiraceae bacterium]